MPRILTGIQSSGRQHLGNLLGGILPALQLGRQVAEPSFFFIADLHSLTTLREAKLLAENTLHTAAAWLACGLDAEKDVFYRQSRVPQVTELAWFLNCFTPFPMLANAHSFKDKSENLSHVNAGLFTYPVLMAADILLYGAELVPVGKDQRQHLEITRDIAETFNRSMGEVFVVPEARILETAMLVPGTDGRKMSKSYDNVVNVFLPEKELKKQVMGILTDSTPMEAPKNPDTCNVYNIFKLLAPPEAAAELAGKYRAGNFGYGHAKLLLLEALLAQFATQRERYNHFINNPSGVEDALRKGERKAAEVANATLARARQAVGYGR